MDPSYPRKDGASCAASLPAVPESFFGELLGNRPNVAPEQLFAWLSKGSRGCSFSPALDVWHAGILLSREVLQCRGSFKAQPLEGLPRGASNPPSLVHAMANRFGTADLYAYLARHGWQIGQPCAHVCAPLPGGPLRFSPSIIRECVRACSTATGEGSYPYTRSRTRLPGHGCPARARMYTLNCMAVLPLDGSTDCARSTLFAWQRCTRTSRRARITFAARRLRSGATGRRRMRRRALPRTWSLGCLSSIHGSGSASRPLCATPSSERGRSGAGGSLATACGRVCGSE